MKPKFYYVVRYIKFLISDSDELSFELIEKKFEEDNPIRSRMLAMEKCCAIQEILDEVRNGDVHKELYSRLDFRDKFMEFCHFHSGVTNPSLFRVEVILIKEKSIQIGDDEDLEIPIHYYVSPLDREDVPSLILNLDQEYGLYKRYDYDTADQVIEVPFWDVEIYDYEHDGEWFAYHSILKTPFDWSPYAKENWWGDPDFANRHMDSRLQKMIRERFECHEELIKGGETETVEFKSRLFNTTDGKDMRFTIAKVICSFLNNKGGNIYIGVDDDGNIKGVNLERRANKDEYGRHFDQLKNSFFSSFSNVIYNNIKGQFVEIDGKDVFVIRVKESRDEPIFIYNELNKQNGTPFQLFVRDGAKSEPLFNPIRMVKYIEEKWWKNKYTKNEE